MLLANYKWCWFEVDFFNSLADVYWAAVNTRQELGAVAILINYLYVFL